MLGKLRLGILGCGTITRLEHLPAVLAHPGVELVALVDSDLQRAQALVRHRSLGCQVSTDYQPLLGQLDALINALPNNLHAPATLDALGNGVHVLCEKPLATNAAQAKDCAAMAEGRGLVLAVGMNRRFVASHRLMHLVLQEGLLGSSLSYSCEYGGAFDWRSASGFYFSKALAGGGVLIDFGVHLLDSLMDWFGPVTGLDYQDDDWGSGIEANAILKLQHSGRYGTVKGKVQLSRTFPLQNRLLVDGENASAEVKISDLNSLLIHRVIDGQQISQSTRLVDYPHTSSFFKQLDNFMSSVRDGREPEVSGWQATRVLQVIEDAYANARRIPEPWSEIASAPLAMPSEVTA
jgi:predicted dehydrogenase